MAATNPLHVLGSSSTRVIGSHPVNIACRGYSAQSAPAGSTSLPDQARVIIAGGGIVGCSIAYHLAKLGWDDVLLLERDKITSGTTWHAAGLMVTFGSLSETSTELRKYSKRLYSHILEEETGMSTGFMPVGFIELATDRGYLEEYRRVAAANRRLGIDVHEISPAEVQRLFPLCRTEDVLAGFYVEDDGRVNPVDATAALARGAKSRGATICEGVEISGVEHRRGRVTGVRTSAGQTVQCEVFVNAAGMWARQLGELSGVAIPNQAAEHYYLLTEPIDHVGRDWPVVEDPSSHTYIRPEGGGLMVGLFETDAAAWRVDGVPHDFSFGEITPDWERIGPFLEKAMARVPASLEVGAKSLFCGPESFTPDLSPIVGLAPELDNYYVAAGMNSIGILTGGGIGRLLAQQIVDGHPDMDVTAMAPARLHPYQTTPAYRAARVVESLGKVYKCHYPNRPTETARGVRRSPLHDRLAARGAYFRDVSGWEGADWFDLNAAATADAPDNGPLTWGRPAWFAHWASEHRACREACALIDMSFMSKFLVQGTDAGALLDRLATARVSGAPACGDDGAVTDASGLARGEITYTQFLSPRGTLEADVTVTRLPPPLAGSSAGGADDDDAPEQAYLVVATDTAQRHVESLLRRGIAGAGPQTYRASVTDVTGGYAQINLQGPTSRALLSKLTPSDVSHEAFPFRAARRLAIGCALVVATRITYVGELGYELFVPVESAAHVYDEIVRVGEAAGDEIGLAHCGLRALGSLRMEKAYRDYGHDLDNLDTLLEAGLGFTADYGKPGGFVGDGATLAQKATAAERGGLPRRLVQVMLEAPGPLLYHGEVVYRNGEAVGDIRSASYGHTLGGAVGLSMVEPSCRTQPASPAWIREGTWEVDVAGVRYPARVSLRPMYDPKNEKIHSSH